MLILLIKNPFSKRFLGLDNRLFLEGGGAGGDEVEQVPGHGGTNLLTEHDRTPATGGLLSHI